MINRYHTSLYCKMFTVSLQTIISNLKWSEGVATTNCTSIPQLDSWCICVCFRCYIYKCVFFFRVGMAWWIQFIVFFFLRGKPHQTGILIMMEHVLDWNNWIWHLSPMLWGGDSINKKTTALSPPNVWPQNCRVNQVVLPLKGFFRTPWPCSMGKCWSKQMRFLAALFWIMPKIILLVCVVTTINICSYIIIYPCSIP